MATARRYLSSPSLLALIGIVLIGAGLRFSTLGLQSYRYDEAVTVGRVLHANLTTTLSEVSRSESTPPLYYLLAWAWSKAFGTGELWMRSISALAGTASIVVVYLGAVSLPLPRRAALIAAAAVAVSPVLIWFSQDARAYALVFLLSALSFLFFARARRGGSSRDLVLWGLVSALALATHYFAGFLIASEAALLLLSGPRRRRVAVACIPIVAMAIALAPVAIKQSEHDHAAWISSAPIGGRLERAAAKLVGGDNGAEHGSRQGVAIPLGVPAGLALLAAVLLVWRGDPAERRSAGVAALVGGGAVALALLAAALGHDYLDGRNLLPAFVPLLIAIAAGFGARRAGPVGLAAAAAFCLCSLFFTLEIDRLPRLQRENLRNAAAVAGPLHAGKALVTQRYTANQPLRYYLGAEFATGTPPPLREIVLVGSAASVRHAGHLLPRAFRRVGSRAVSYDFTLARFRAARPVPVPLRRLENAALVGGPPSVLVAPVRAR
ncbi:MAG: glycosyltransferase family 39 protein [Actinobacteria bacterium]|nr:glycosyltransferase family 39 protein [Actinomycetota bacterium]